MISLLDTVAGGQQARTQERASEPGQSDMFAATLDELATDQELPTKDGETLTISTSPPQEELLSTDTDLALAAGEKLPSAPRADALLVTPAPSDADPEVSTEPGKTGDGRAQLDADASTQTVKTTGSVDERLLVAASSEKLAKDTKNVSPDTTRQQTQATDTAPGPSSQSERRTSSGSETPKSIIAPSTSIKAEAQTPASTSAEAHPQQIADAQGNEKNAAPPSPSLEEIGNKITSIDKGVPVVDIKQLATQNVETSVTAPAAINSEISVSASAPAAASTINQASLAPKAVAPTALPVVAMTDIPDVVTQSATSPDRANDRVVVQLDPPELGRVSIDFKFDAGMLQAVTITGESPEALRQLRQMHFELINSLEQQGISGSDLTFTHEQFSEHTNTGQTPDLSPENIAENTLPASSGNIDYNRPSLAMNGLDIKL